jgi:two-component system CheB/CheR fusion protein
LALHELATNSLKFGALTTPQGRITVHWQTDWSRSPPRLRVSWIETGVKIATVAPRRRGFGQELIEHTLPYQLNAQTRFTFLPGGLHCVIDIPLNERTTTASTLGRAPEGDGGHGTNSVTR